MSQVHCYTQNLELSKKIFQQLDISDLTVSYQTTAFKIEKCKHVSIVFLDSSESVLSWEEYFAKLSSDKKNLIQKYILPIAVDHKKLSANNDHGVLSMEGTRLNNIEINILKMLLCQKLDYYNFKIECLIQKGHRLLFGLAPKLSWRNQVVLTSDEVKSFLDVKSFDKGVLHNGESINLSKIEEYSKLGKETDGSVFLLISNELVKFQSNELSEEKIRKIILFLILNENRMNHNSQLIHTEFMISFFEQIFQAAPFPIAVELDERDLVWQNKYFSNLKLFPKMFKKIENGGKIHTKHGFFIVYKNQFLIEDQLFQLVFLAQQSEEITNTGEDLGIITSSLAHEMNNPLAAIKAAIELILLMETNLKSKETLDQMLVSVNRCLQLVKIFLGFTKVSISLNKPAQEQTGAGKDLIPFHECWDYALQLMRTRLVSSSIRINPEWERTGYFKITNSNIVTMMIYWMLNQIVNSFERKVLISGKVSQDQKVIIFEDNTEVQISLEISVKDLIIQLEQSLLMKHLLELESMELLFPADNKLILTRK